MSVVWDHAKVVMEQDEDKSITTVWVALDNGRDAICVIGKAQRDTMPAADKREDSSDA